MSINDILKEDAGMSDEAKEKLSLYKKGAMLVITELSKFGNENGLGPKDLMLIMKLSAVVGEEALHQMDEDAK